MSATWDSKGVKATPVSADELLIIDTEDARNQKRATIASLPGLGSDNSIFQLNSNISVFDTGIGSRADFVIDGNTSMTLNQGNLKLFTIGIIMEGDGSLAGIQLDTFSNDPIESSLLFLGRARGTVASPLAVQTDDVISELEVAGHTGSGFSTSGKLRFLADGNFTPTSQPTRFEVELTAVSTSIPQQVFAIGEDGTYNIFGNDIINIANAIVTGRLQQRLSPSSITSASTITLNTDGNVFKVDTSNTVNLINSDGWQNGSVITILPQGFPTFTSSGTSSGLNFKILLDGDRDFAMQSGDTLTLVLHNDLSIWIETARCEVSAVQKFDLDMGTHKITSLVDPTVAQDAATKNYVDTHELNGVWTKSGTDIFPTTLTDFVGMGTNSPNQMLHVLTPSGVSTYTSGPNRGILMTHDVGPRLVFEASDLPADKKVMTILYEAQNMFFSSLNDSGSSFDVASILVLNRNGNIGIGTNPLSSLLHVAGTVKITDTLDMTSQLINNVQDPVSLQDAATKNYVDSANGASAQVFAQLATTANVTLSGEQTIDGVLTSTSRVVVKDQTDQTENGIYLTDAGAWTRTTDANSPAELINIGALITEGTANTNLTFTQTNFIDTIGVESVTFFAAEPSANKISISSNTLFVTSQADLENQLNSTLTIPDNVNLTIYIQNNFTLTKGFKIGTNSAVILDSLGVPFLFYAPTISDEPLFANVNPSNPISGAAVRGIFVFDISIGSTSVLFDVTLDALAGLVDIRTSLFFDWGNLGKFTNGVVLITGSNFNGYKQGFLCESVTSWSTSNSIAIADFVTPSTFVTFKSTAFSEIIIRDWASNLDVNDSFVFIDPNQGAGSTATLTADTITDGTGTLRDLFQTGTDIQIPTVTDNGGQAVFDTDSAEHGLSVNDIADIDGFTTNTAYNGSFLVTVVGSTTTFETGVAFGTTEVGNLKDRPIEIATVTDNGGQAVFNTQSLHQLFVGKAVVISGFITNTAYNGTFIVTVVGAVNTFETGVAFGSNETVGTMNSDSLDGTNTAVNAFGNTGIKDSLAAAEARSTTDLLVDVVTQNVFVPIEDTTPTTGDFVADIATEGFTIDLSTGLATYIGIEPLTCVISYQVKLVKVSGGDPTVTVSIFKNGSEVLKTDDVVMAPVDPGVRAGYISGLFDVANGDTFQLFLANNTNATDITASNLALTIREA